MEVSSVQTLTVHKSHRQWENQLSFETRQKFITYYQEGYAIYKIASSHQVTAGTVEYHLRNAGVYLPGKKPTKRGIEIPGTEKVLPTSHGLSSIVINFYKPKNRLEQVTENEDRRTMRMQKSFPKSYREYLERAKKRHPRDYNGTYASTVNTYKAS